MIFSPLLAIKYDTCVEILYVCPHLMYHPFCLFLSLIILCLQPYSNMPNEVSGMICFLADCYNRWSK